MLSLRSVVAVGLVVGSLSGSSAATARSHHPTVDFRGATSPSGRQVSFKLTRDKPYRVVNSHFGVVMDCDGKAERIAVGDHSAQLYGGYFYSDSAIVDVEPEPDLVTQVYIEGHRTSRTTFKGTVELSGACHSRDTWVARLRP